jgi:hypothetical protein
MTGESLEESWRILPLVPQIISLQRSSAAMGTPSTVIGGVLEQLCLNVKLAGHRFVQKRLMTRIERLSTGVKLFTSLKMFSWDLKRRTL